MATTVDSMSLGLTDGRQIVIHEAARRHPAEFALAAYCGDGLVGMLVCGVEPPNGHAAIVVKPEGRGLGVGGSLLGRMAERAPEIGYSYLTLSDRAANQTAASLLASSNLVTARRVRDSAVKAALFLPSAVSNIAEQPLAA
jgi:GNAT superfamily N-acetyltransferase